MEGADIILDLLKKDREYFMMISSQKFDSNKLATFLTFATYLASRSISRSKQYKIKLKPIYSALKWDALGLTSLKSLTKFLPLPNSGSDLVNALWDAAKYIFFKVIWDTTKCVLERLAVLCFSPRIAWKLVRDVAASVARMGVKGGVSGFKYIFKAAKTTFLGNAIGASASWLVQVGLHIFIFFVPEKSDIPVKDTWERVWILGKKILGTTVTCIVSLIFACICAAIGALIFGSIGTWIGAFSLPFILAWILTHLFSSTMGLLIGFAVGDFVGDALVSFVSRKLGL